MKHESMHCEAGKSAVAATRSDTPEQCPPVIRPGVWEYPPQFDLQLLASGACYKGFEGYIDQKTGSISSPYKIYLTVQGPHKQGMGQALKLALENLSTRPEYRRTATIGGIVMLPDRRFYLAPAHVFYPQSHLLPDMVPERSRSEDSECEFGGFEDGDAGISDSPEAEFMSQYNLTRKSSDLEENRDLGEADSNSDADFDCLNLEDQAEEPTSCFVAPGNDADCVPGRCEHSLLHPPCLGAELLFFKSDDLDYCLIEVDETEHYMPNLPVLSQESISQLESGPVDVTAVTGSGNVLTGVLSNGPYARLPGARSFVHVLSVKFKGSLQLGDAGSIVRDANTGIIYGHIVAGDTNAQVAMVIPAVDVLNDLMAKSVLTGIPSAELENKSFTH